MAKKAYIKSSVGRDYNYDRARGTYVKSFGQKAIDQAERKLLKQQQQMANEQEDDEDEESIIMKDMDDHGRFSGGEEGEEGEAVAENRKLTVRLSDFLTELQAEVSAK